MKRKTSRSKATRKAKTVVRKSVKQNALAVAAEIEKEFFALPTKLVALCRREHALIKQSELKLKAALKGATAKYQAAVKKVAAQKKSKRPVSRKQLSATKKLVATANRWVAEINRDIKVTLKSVEGILKKQAGFAHLSKELPKLRRQMQTAGIKAKKKPVRRKKVSAVRRPGSVTTKIRHDSHQSIPVLSTRVDTSEIT